MDASLVRNLDYVLDSIKQKNNTEQIVDARPKGRFDGTAPEPRPGLPSGHMPNAVNLPFMDLMDAETRCMLPAAQLRDRFNQVNIQLEHPILCTCGTP